MATCTGGIFFPVTCANTPPVPMQLSTMWWCLYVVVVCGGSSCILYIYMLVAVVRNYVVGALFVPKANIVVLIWCNLPWWCFCTTNPCRRSHCTYACIRTVILLHLALALQCLVHGRVFYVWSWWNDDTHTHNTHTHTHIRTPHTQLQEPTVLKHTRSICKQGLSSIHNN